MNVIWTPLTTEEIAALRPGDSVVIHAGSKGAFQWHESQKLHPEFFYIRHGKFVERNKKGTSVLLERKALMGRSGCR